jgi:hypothetical protein
MVSAETGSTDMAKPLANVVTTKARRDNGAPENKGSE